eukprot:scaffold34817_cov50-Phaeocystis_antarctica.AAC.2
MWVPSVCSTYWTVALLSTSAWNLLHPVSDHSIDHGGRAGAPYGLLYSLRYHAPHQRGVRPTYYGSTYYGSTYYGSTYYSSVECARPLRRRPQRRALLRSHLGRRAPATVCNRGCNRM